MQKDTLCSILYKEDAAKWFLYLSLPNLETILPLRLYLSPSLPQRKRLEKYHLSTMDYNIH